MARTDTIDVNGDPMHVYVGVPAGAGPRPGVVVMVHGPGLDDFIRSRVESLAEHGFIALAPDLFHRQPDDGTDTRTRVGRLLDRDIVADADATIAHLLSFGEERVGRLAVLGFCMGGRHAYLLAGARPAAWSAAGVFYGGNIMEPWGDGPAPFDLTERIDCSVLGIFGADDTNPSPDDVVKVERELTRLGKSHEFHVYDDAGHAFLNFSNAERYRPEQADDAWSKLIAFFERHLGADRRVAAPSR
jgi:carboxymethylenebutenolidase